MSDADAQCDRCVRGVTRIKIHLTQKWIDRWVAKKTEHCNELNELKRKEECFVRIAIGRRDYQYLLDHTPIEYCQWIKKCPALVKSMALLQEELQDEPDWGETPCDRCLAYYSQVKPQLSPEYIEKNVVKLRENCDEMSDELEKEDCLAEAEEINQALTYLLHHSVQEFCEWTEDCPSVGGLALLLSKFPRSILTR